MASRWTSSVTLRWTPILTYGRRRLALLDWMDENANVVAFRDGDDSISFAFAALDLRAHFRRNGLTLSSGASGIDMREILDEPVSGALAILEPSRLSVLALGYHTSAGLRTANYADATARFSRNALGGAEIAGLAHQDASILADVTIDDYETQVEFGIVSRSEMVDRLTGRDVGRIQSDQEHPLARMVEARTSDAPDVSLYVESQSSPVEPAVSGLPEVWEHWEKAGEMASQLTDAIAAPIDIEEDR